SGDAGVVDEHVDLAELGDGSLHGAIDRRLIGDVDARRAVQIPDRHLRSGGLEALRDRRADALRAARHDCNPAGEIELIHEDAKYNRVPSGRSHMAGRLAGKTAFITAAAQGMGQATALAFAREGARVWATDLNAQQLKALEGKDGIRTRQLDVTDEAAIARVAQEVGDVEVLFNCAGIVHNGSILE